MPGETIIDPIPLNGVGMERSPNNKTEKKGKERGKNSTTLIGIGQEEERKGVLHFSLSPGPLGKKGTQDNISGKNCPQEKATRPERKKERIIFHCPEKKAALMAAGGEMAFSEKRESIGKSRKKKKAGYSPRNGRERIGTLLVLKKKKNPKRGELGEENAVFSRAMK